MIMTIEYMLNMMGVNQCHLDKIKKEYKDEGTGFCKCHNTGSENNTLSQINGKGKELHDKKAGLHLRLKKV